jgi:WD40 repeat protein
VCNLTQDAQDFTLALYDLADDVLMANLPMVHTDLIMSVAFSPPGNMLATGGGDQRVVLWDVKGQRPLWTIRSDFILVTSIAFTPDGRTLFASSWDQNIRSWNVQDPTQSQTWPGHSAGVNRLAIAPDGRSLASASSDGRARLWTLPTAETAPTLEVHDEFTTLFPLKDMLSPKNEPVSIFGVVESPAQNQAVATENRSLLLCDLGTRTVLKIAIATNVFKHVGTAFMRPSFSPDGRELAVGNTDGGVAFLEADTLQLLRELTHLHSRQITHIAYAQNGTVLVTGGGYGTGIKLTEVASGRTITNFSGVAGSFPLQPLAVSRDGKRLATGSPETRVHVWDIAACRVVAASPQKVRLLHAVAFAPDGKLLAFADERGAIFLWDLTGRRPLRKRLGHAGPANALAFSPDGRTLASGGMDHTIRLWHPEIDQEVAVLKGHNDWIWCVAFAEHGCALLSGSRDGTLKLWQALSFEQIATQPVAQSNLSP